MHDQPVTDESPNLEPLVGLFRLLSDQTRLNILMILAKGERNVGSLCEELGLPQPTVSHHLGLLRSRNLLQNRRMGKQVFYGLSTPAGSNEVLMSFLVRPFEVRIHESANGAVQ
jgi:DNA-binding transcriptional ArsR family regulator